MLKKILLAAAFAALLSTSAYAAGINYDINYENGEVTINGTVDDTAGILNKYVSIFVLNPGIKQGELPSNFENGDYLQYQNVILLNADDKSFEMTFAPKMLESDIPYTIAANMNNSLYTKELYVYAKEDVNEFTQELNMLAEDAENKTEMFLKAVCIYSANRGEACGKFDSELEDMSGGMAEIFFNERGDGFVVDESADEPYKDITEAIEKAVLWAAYNKKITGGELIGAETIGFDSDEYAYDIYETRLSEEGKKALVNGLSGSNVEELIKSFRVQAVYALMSYPGEYGYRQLMTTIEEDEARKTLVDEGFNYELYQKSDRDKVCTELYKDVQSDMASLVAKLNELSEEYPASTGNQGSNHGGGGGSGSGSGSGGTTASKPIIPPAEQPVPVIEDVFTDLDSVPWAKQSIMALYAKGIVSGMGDKKFAPTEFVTREQFVKILVSALGMSTEGSECEFADVDKNMWYYPYVACAVQNNIVYGIDENYFGTGSNITREQIAAMCARVVGRTSDKTVEDFVDQDEISDYAKESVMLMKRLGVVSGNENGEFNPKDYATRAEAAQIIYTMINL